MALLVTRWLTARDVRAWVDTVPDMSEYEKRHVQTSGSLPALSNNTKKTIRVTRKPGKK